MGRRHILQKNGPLTTEIVIKFRVWPLLVKVENDPYHGLPIPITEYVVDIRFVVQVAQILVHGQ